MGDSVEIEVKKRAGIKRRFRELQKFHRAKRRKVPTSVSKAISLFVKLVDDAVVASSHGANNVAEPRVDELAWHMAGTRAEVVSLTAKLSNLGEASD